MIRKNAGILLSMYLIIFNVMFEFYFFQHEGMNTRCDEFLEVLCNYIFFTIFVLLGNYYRAGNSCIVESEINS